MSLKQDRQRVQLAARRLISQRRQLHRETQRLSDDFERYRPILIVGGGLIAGLLIGRGKLTDATRAVSSMAALGMSLMRSSLGTLMLSRTFRVAGEAASRTDKRANPQS